ncbi:MAG TPA: CBS domain-containing protein [Anaerolineaceae bacterium]
MLVRKYMKTHVYSIHATQTIAEAARLFVDKHIGALPVIDQDNRLLGIVYDFNLIEIGMPDFTRLLSHFEFLHDLGALEMTNPDAAELHRPVAAIMHPAVTVDETDSILLAAALLHKNSLNDLPVVDNQNRLVGIVSHVDISTAIMKDWLNE